MDILNPHDKFFKETFGRVAVAKDFLYHYLPQSIVQIVDMDTLVPQKDSYINNKLRESFSDLLFSAEINAREGYIYFLFEHKSSPSRDIGFQLLKYMVEIWNTKISKEEIYELPVIIPLVVYHGEKGWGMQTIGNMIPGYEELPKDVQEFVPTYKYVFHDLSKLSDEDIKGEARTRIAQTLFRDYNKDDWDFFESFFRVVAGLNELESRQAGIEYFETAVKYAFSSGKNLTPADIDIIIKRIENVYPEGSEKLMTIAEMLREEGIEKGMEKGIEKGIEKGETKALVRTAIKLLTRKFGSVPEELRVGISKLDAPTLDAMIDGILDYESLEEVKRYLQ